MFVYEKATLTAYDKIEEVLAGFDAVFEKKALTPYSRSKTALAQIDELIELMQKKDELIEFYTIITDALDSLKPEHRRILGEKYGFIGSGVTDPLNRNYFRKTLLATKNFARAMESLGFTPEKYEEIAKNFCFFDEILSDKKRSEKHVKRLGCLRTPSAERDGST